MALYFLVSYRVEILKGIMLKLLLENGAERAKSVLENFKPQFATKEEFLAYKDSLECSGDRIIYSEDKAEVRL